MKNFRFGLNNKIKVKLTENGKEHFSEKITFNESINIDKDGYTKILGYEFLQMVEPVGYYFDPEFICMRGEELPEDFFEERISFSEAVKKDLKIRPIEDELRRLDSITNYNSTAIERIIDGMMDGLRTKSWIKIINNISCSDDVHRLMFDESQKIWIVVS